MVRGSKTKQKSMEYAFSTLVGFSITLKKNADQENLSGVSVSSRRLCSVYLNVSCNTFYKTGVLGRKRV